MKLNCPNCGEHLTLAAQIERAGRAYPAPQAYWQQAIEVMISGRDKLTLPLKSHGYLLSIIVGFAEKNDAKAEKATEQGRKYGPVMMGAYITQASRIANKVPDHHVEATDKAVQKDRGVAPLKNILNQLTGAFNHAE